VAETASQKGVSKQKLLDEILSSYWVLEELSGVVSDSAVTNNSPQPDEGTAADTVDHGRETVSQGADISQTDRSTAEFSELKSELQGLRTAIEELSQDQHDEPQHEEAAEDGFSVLEGQLDDLSSAVVDRQTETDETIDELSERIESVDKRLAGIESRLDDGISLAELEAAVEQNSADYAELQATVEANSTDHAELEQQLESEFDSIEQVLQHLLDTTDNIEYRLGAVSDSRQEALRPLRERNAQQDALTDLKQEAIRHGVSNGVCGNCDQKIDLGLLEVPECPSCEQRFTGISKGGWNWIPFSRSTINTTDRPQQFDSADSSPRQSDAGDRPPSTHKTGGQDSYQTDW
jgi:Zn finger protein HypA/HybF involved in hydrogenase expression/outer membrane murein-binding lipoprotein Lpp